MLVLGLNIQSVDCILKCRTEMHLLACRDIITFHSEVQKYTYLYQVNKLTFNRSIFNFESFQCYNCDPEDNIMDNKQLRMDLPISTRRQE